MQVEIEPDLYTKVEVEFDSGERPDYEDFCLGPLAAIVFACESGHVRAHPLAGYPNIYTTLLPASGLFPPIVFSLALVDKKGTWLIYDYAVDNGYWELLQADPAD